MAKKKSDESLVVEDIDDEVVELPATDSVELPTIESLDDVKELVNDGIDGAVWGITTGTLGMPGARKSVRGWQDKFFLANKDK